MPSSEIAELRELRQQLDAARERLAARVRDYLRDGASPALVARSVGWSREHVSKLRMAQALEDFRRLGHDVDERVRETDAYGRPQWPCRRCGSPLSIDGSGQRWVAPSGLGRCPHSPGGEAGA
jgi:hypothetical protein